MAEAAAAAAERTILERVRRFQFDRFDQNVEEWTYYIQRFENELAIHGLLAEDAAVMHHRRNLLLSRIGPEAFKVVVDHFRPVAVNTCTYHELKQVLQRFYQQNICIMAERVVFAQRHRKEEETVTQFINALRALAGNCDFGASLAERLRDQLVIGLNNDTWQKEIFRLHPTNESTLAQIEATIIVLEQASVQQQRLHSLQTKGASPDTSVRRISTKPSKSQTSPKLSPARRTSGQQQQHTSSKARQLIKGRHCLKCGYNIHSNNETCPAVGVVCSACQKRNHFARVCVKSGNAVITSSYTGKPDRKRLNKVGFDTESDVTDYQSDADSLFDLNMIASVKHNGRLAVLHAKLNGHKLRMLYDPGAAFSVISHSTWQQIGSPPLSPVPNLMAFTKIPIVTLGSATVHVDAFNQHRKSLTVIVVKGEDTPLFGLDWVLKFGLPLPEGVTVCALRPSTSPKQPMPTQLSTKATQQRLPPTSSTSTTTLTPPIDSRFQQLLDEYADIFSPGHGIIRGQEAVVHIDPNARPKAFWARPVPFPLRKAVEAELDRLTVESILEPVYPRVTPIEWASPIVIAIKNNGAVRICGDFKVTINPHIVPDKYPLPRFEEIAAKLNNSRYFSVVDLKDAFLQLPVAESSRKYLV